MEGEEHVRKKTREAVLVGEAADSGDCPGPRGAAFVAPGRRCAVCMPCLCQLPHPRPLSDSEFVGGV